MNKPVPPKGYATWLDYAVEAMETRHEYLSRLWDGEGVSREDMHQAARDELAELRNGSAPKEGT